jgi:hypothetical protein
MAWENGYLNIVKNGISSNSEAVTSRYVYHVLLSCLNWKMEDINPQTKCLRGFVDYSLDCKTSSTVIEVKRFKARLKEEDIRPYLVNPGPQSRDIVVGVLTNLAQWKIYVAGKHVKQVCGEKLLHVKTIEIRHRKDINDLRRLIGARGNGHFKALRASLGESPSILRHLISNDKQVLKAVRTRLAYLQDRRKIDARVPQNDSLRKWISEVLHGNSATLSGWSPAILKQTLRSKPVVGAANSILQSLCGSRSRNNKLRRTINQILKECSNRRLEKAA